MTQNKPKNADYSDKNIPTLTPHEHVRRRPGMYIGGTDIRALHHLIWATTDHMIEEAMAGLCGYVYLHLLPGNKVIIENDGISLLHGTYTEKEAKERIVDLLTEFTSRTPVSEMYFGVQGGLHGIGLAIVNCLANKFRLEIQRDGHILSQEYKQGIATGDIQYMQVSGDTNKTRLIFTPDFEIMDENEFDFDMIATRFKDLSYLLPGVAFHIEDQRWGQKQTQFLSTEGLKEWVVENRKASPLHEVISGEATCEFINQTGEVYKAIAQFAFQFTCAESSNEHSFINTVLTPDGGTHIEGLHKAILNAVLPENSPQWENINAGFVGVVHLLHPEPEFEGRTRFKIRNTDAYPVVKKALETAIESQGDEFEQVRQLLLSRV